MAKLRTNLVVFLAFVLVTLLLTYPQARMLRTAIADHPDPYFSIWRLGWVAHQLASDPIRLFDANIFHPEPRTFAYSDTMLLPATALAPLFWMRANPVLVYNVALLGALALSGFTMFLLARELTGHGVAAFAAGLVYGFAPYRFEQYIHLEMQMVFWIPLALLALHRVFARRRLGDGIWLGLAVAAQTLSGMYGAICFLVCAALFVPVLALTTSAARPAQLAAPLAVAAVAAAVIIGPYGIPYLRVQDIAGDRTVREIMHYGASLANYVAAPPINRVYGWTASRFGAEELYLFPGALAIALAVAGLFQRSRVAIAYLVMLLFAMEASRGFDGITYPLLFRFIGPFRGLRVPARFDLIVNLSLGVLAAIGCTWLLQKIGPRWRTAASIALVGGLLVEYASAPALALVPKTSLADGWLKTQPKGVLVELPLPTPATMWPNNESRYMYEGMAHWLPMVNGYSGYFPSSYLELVDVMQTFPDARSLAHLKARGVDYVFVRGSLYDQEALARLRAELERTPGLSLLAAFPPPGNELIFRMR